MEGDELGEGRGRAEARCMDRYAANLMHATPKKNTDCEGTILKIVHYRSKHVWGHKILNVF